MRRSDPMVRQQKRKLFFDRVIENGHEVKSLLCDQCGFEYSFVMNCGDRLCDTCRRKRFGVLMNRYKKFFASLKAERLRFVLLTVKNGLDLGERRVHLMRSWKKLMAMPFYKRAFAGGVYAIQTTMGAGGWHVHLHLIVEGNFVAWEILKKDWLAITGDSFIIGVEEIKDPVRALGYVLGYVLQDVGKLSGSQADEYNKVFSGRRLLQSFGTWHGQLRLEADEFVCPECGHVSWISSDFGFSYFKAWALVRRRRRAAALSTC